MKLSMERCIYKSECRFSRGKDKDVRNHFLARRGRFSTTSFVARFFNLALILPVYKYK